MNSDASVALIVADDRIIASMGNKGANMLDNKEI